jgi:hypothetical protein
MEKVLIYTCVGFCLIIIGFVISIAKHDDINYRVTGVCIASLGIFMIVSFILYACYVVLFKNRNKNNRRFVNDLVSRYTEEKIEEGQDQVYSDVVINQDTIETGSIEGSYLEVGEYDENVFTDN